MDIDDDAVHDDDQSTFVAGDDAQEAHAEAAARSRSPSESPDVVGREEMEDMRSRALAIKESTTVGDVEKELVDMVLRLTDTGIPLQDQVVEQADTISNLSRQREFILERTEEERGRWDAERESWSRIADAVMTHANKPTPTIYKDPTKPTPFLESDNAILRSKLTDAQQRLSALEAELAQLKPILLVKPFALTHSSTTNNTSKKKRHDGPVAGPSTSKPDTAPRPYYRSTEPTAQVTFLPPIVHKAKSTSVGKHGPITADARSEHLLLAARRIGRERVVLLNSSALKAEELAPPAFITSPSAKGKGRADEPHIHAMPGNPYTIHYPTTPTPKTPQKGTPMRVPTWSPQAAMPFNPNAQHILVHSPPIPRLPGGPHPPPFAYVPSPIPGPAYAIYGPAYGYGPMPAPSNSPTRSSVTNSPSVPAPQLAAPRPSTSKAAADPPAPRAKRATAKRKGQASQPPEQPVASSSRSTNAITRNGSASAPSPFDLLHSAAQSMLSPAGDVESRSTMPMATRRQKRAAFDDEDDDMDIPTSPTPTKKRARITTDMADREGRGDNGGLRRGSSALDVLADQAMFFGSQSMAGSNVSHSRSGSEHSFAGSGHDSASDAGPSMRQPARWGGATHASASRPSAPPKAGNRQANSMPPKQKTTRSSTNGQSSSRRVNTRAAAQAPNRVVDENYSESESEPEPESGADDERRSSVGEGSASALPKQRAANSAGQQQGHEKLRKEWLKKLGMFK
ncbi:hypothetical protein SCHPADRAFT_1002632 [Schizopora paradoxa]|uniref:Uncharacterized protein n=1 Tax=Schizopora paradoxa TaxID=27342 RepID=A0A0H2RM67_9AGAM|nr:hypothetical protein SCHPADRAFT_1002632 [Schizopora paradoxa]